MVSEIVINTYFPHFDQLALGIVHTLVSSSIEDSQGS